MTTSASLDFTTDHVTSADGTRIGYRRFTNSPNALKPGIIALTGAGQSARDFTKLAQDLAEDFTTYVPDRRGRGLSGSLGDDYTDQTEVADVIALLEATGASYLFGLSSGALIALDAALAYPALKKLALYEPPLSIDHSVDSSWVAKYEKELTEGDLSAALVTTLQGTKVAPAALRHAPRLVSEKLVDALLRRPDPDPTVALAVIIPTIHYDAVIVKAHEGRLGSYAALAPETLLLGGSKSPEYLKTALGALADTIPHAVRVTLRGSGHSAPDNNSQPTLVAEKLRLFFN